MAFIGKIIIALFFILYLAYVLFMAGGFANVLIIMPIKERIYDRCWGLKDNERKSVYRKIKCYLIFTIPILVIVLIFSGLHLNKYVLAHKVTGLTTVCYVTDTGEKYHEYDCYYLKSVNKTNVYEAKKDGYTACSRCYVGPVEESIKNEYGWSIFISTVVFSSLYVLSLFSVTKIFIRLETKPISEKSKDIVGVVVMALLVIGFVILVIVVLGNPDSGYEGISENQTEYESHSLPADLFEPITIPEMPPLPEISFDIDDFEVQN